MDDIALLSFGQNYFIFHLNSFKTNFTLLHLGADDVQYPGFSSSIAI